MRLPQKVSNLLEKSKESALLAVDIYNKPKTAFRSGGFIVLMSIAWLALLHSIFERKKIKYYHKEKNGRYTKIDGEKKAWSLNKSAAEFFDETSPIKRNLELFIMLRNKIEHRFMPSLDPVISGECQALLLNLEDLIVKEYGSKHSLVEDLFIPLQFTKKVNQLPKNRSEKEVLDFVKNFRSSLSSDISQSQEFAFKAYFIPKLGNHRSSSDIAIEFVKFDPENPEEMKQYEKMIIGMKEKLVPVANPGKYRPGKVLKILEERGHRNLSMNWHTDMWKKHKVRPSTKDKDKAKCNTKYCQFDEASTLKDYVYTDDWIEILETELTQNPQT